MLTARRSRYRSRNRPRRRWRQHDGASPVVASALDIRDPDGLRSFIREAIDALDGLDVLDVLDVLVSNPSAYGGEEDDA